MALNAETGDDDAERYNYRLARELDVRAARHLVADKHPVTRLDKLGAVVPGTTFIHGNGMDDQEFGAIRENGCGLLAEARSAARRLTAD